MSKFTPELKLCSVFRHLKYGESYDSIAKSIGADKSSVREWCHNYETMGEQAFSSRGNARYSQQFKEACVKYYLDGKGSLPENPL